MKKGRMTINKYGIFWQIRNFATSSQQRFENEKKMVDFHTGSNGGGGQRISFKA